MATGGGVGLRVLVAGAGIAGLGAARALRQLGCDVDVVDRRESWASGGTGIFLPANAVRALEELGLASAVIARAATIPRQIFCDERGRVLAQIDVEAMWRGVGPCVALHRTALHEVLAHGAEPVPVRLGVSVRDIHQSGPAAARSENVRVDFRDATAKTYGLVVGADGVHSTVRRLTAPDCPPRALGLDAWRFVTACPSSVTTWTVLLGRSATFLVVPIGDGLAYCYGDAAAARSLTEPDDPRTRLAALFGGFGGPVPAILERLTDDVEIHVAPVEEIRLDPCAYGSVLLIGDAAHAMPPNMAAGAGLALEDGLVLAECLSAAPDLPTALHAFESRRQPRVEWVRAQTRRRDRTRALPGPMRNAVIRAMGRRLHRASYRPLLDRP